MTAISHGTTTEETSERNERDEWIRKDNRKKVARWNKESRQSQDGIDCPVCLNKHFVFELSQDGMEIIRRPCKCMKKRQIISNANRSGLGAMLGKKLTDYQTAEPWQKQVKEKAVLYMKEPAGWFVISGEPGSGKTLICMIIANQLLRQGRLVQFISWPELVRETNVDFYKEKDVLQKYKEIDVLYIDDFLKVADNGRAIQIAYEILNYRYAHEQPTIISGERSIKEIMLIDKALAGRIYEMAARNLIELGHDPARNQRMKGRKNESSNTDRQTDC